MNRRDRTAEDMALDVVAQALAEAGVAAADVNLVVVGNATAGRLIDQGCIRGQTFLRQAGLRNAGIVNVDNSCAGGSSALHLATLATLARHPHRAGRRGREDVDRRPGETLAGIEDGVPRIDRAYLHDKLENPSGSVLMALNATWAVGLIEERGATVEQFAAAAVKSRRHGALNPNAQFQTGGHHRRGARVAGHRPAPHPADVLVVHRRGRRRGAVGHGRRPGRHRGSGPARCARATATSTTTTAWPRRPRRPGRTPASTPTTSTWSSCTTPPAPRSSTPSSRSGFFKPGDAGPATVAGDTSIGGKGVTVNTSGGLLGRGHPLGATGIAQVVELVAQLRGRAGAARSTGPDWRWPPTPVA